MGEITVVLDLIQRNTLSVPRKVSKKSHFLCIMSPELVISDGLGEQSDQTSAGV